MFIPHTVRGTRHCILLSTSTRDIEQMHRRHCPFREQLLLSALSSYRRHCPFREQLLLSAILLSLLTDATVHSGSYYYSLQSYSLFLPTSPRSLLEASRSAPPFCRHAASMTSKSSSHVPTRSTRISSAFQCPRTARRAISLERKKRRLAYTIARPFADTAAPTTPASSVRDLFANWSARPDLGRWGEAEVWQRVWGHMSATCVGEISR